MNALSLQGIGVEVVYFFKRVMERKKNQNGFTVEQLEQVIEQLYES